MLEDASEQAVYGWEYYAKTDIAWTQDIRFDEALYKFPPDAPVGKVPCFECQGTGWDQFEPCNVCKSQGLVYVGLI